MKNELMVRPSHRLAELFDWDTFPTVFPDVARWFDDRRPSGPGAIRVEEEVVDGMLHVRAEVPGIDPDKDAEVAISDGRLTIKVERRSQERTDTDGGFRSEFHYGSFFRTVPVPKDLDAKKVKATYADGVLDITVPMPAAKATEPTKVAIKRS